MTIFDYVKNKKDLQKKYVKSDIALFSRVEKGSLADNYPITFVDRFKKHKDYFFFGYFNENGRKVKDVLTGEVYDLESETNIFYKDIIKFSDLFVKTNVQTGFNSNITQIQADKFKKYYWSWVDDGLNKDRCFFVLEKTNEFASAKHFDMFTKNELKQVLNELNSTLINKFKKDFYECNHKKQVKLQKDKLAEKIFKNSEQAKKEKSKFEEEYGKYKLKENQRKF